MIKLQELISKFLDKPTKQNEYEIDGKKYIVVSHFVGDKDIDIVINKLAIQEVNKTI